MRFVLLLPGPGIREGHSAEPEVQPGRLDDDGGIETVDRRIVREPGGHERLHGAAEVDVVADGEREEVGRAGCRALSLGAGMPWRASVLGGAARLPRRGALRRGGCRRCQFDLVEGEGVIVLVARLLQKVDPLCKNMVAIYGTKVVNAANTPFGEFLGGRRGDNAQSKDRRV